MSISSDKWSLGKAEQDCGSARWYVVNTHVRAEVMALMELQRQRFRAHLPMVCLAPRKPGDAPRVVPYFPSYLFVAFDKAADPWRRICSTRGVKRLFSASSECPIPVPAGVVEALIAKEAILLKATPDKPAEIPANSPLKVLDGAFEGHTGLCLWSDDQRVSVLMEIMGRATKVEMPRMVVEVVS